MSNTTAPTAKAADAKEVIADAAKAEKVVVPSPDGAAASPNAPLRTEVPQQNQEVIEDTNTPAGPSAVAALPNVKGKKEAKRSYRVVAGKTFLRDEDGNEVRADIGDIIKLTDSEAKGRAGQVEIVVAALKENDD